MYYWHNGNDWTFLYNIGTPLIDSMVNQSFLSIQPLLLIFILNLILRLSTFLCPCLFVSFLYHLMNTIFQCCMKMSNHFHLTRSTTIQLSLFCCLSSHSKHFFKKLEQKQGWIVQAFKKKHRRFCSKVWKFAYRVSFWCWTRLGSVHVWIFYGPT